MVAAGHLGSDADWDRTSPRTGACYGRPFRGARPVRACQLHVYPFGTISVSRHANCLHAGALHPTSPETRVEPCWRAGGWLMGARSKAPPLCIRLPNPDNTLFVCFISDSLSETGGCERVVDVRNACRAGIRRGLRSGWTAFRVLCRRSSESLPRGMGEGAIWCRFQRGVVVPRRTYQCGCQAERRT